MPRRRAALLLVAAIVLALAGTQTGAADPDLGSAAAWGVAVSAGDRGSVTRAAGPGAPTPRHEPGQTRDLRRFDGLLAVQSAQREQRALAAAVSERTANPEDGRRAVGVRQSSRTKRTARGRHRADDEARGGSGRRRGSQAGSRQSASDKTGRDKTGSDKARRGKGDGGKGRRGGTKRRPKVVYLTFDDGPSSYTQGILKVLRKHRSTATFFVLGSQAKRHPELVRAIRRQGSNLGYHSHDHPFLTRLSDRALRQQLRPTVKTGCFRPPYGATNRRVVRLARERRLRQVLWTADSRDWEKPGERTIRRNSLLDLHRGSIILMHDGGGDRTQTVAALPGLLRELHRRGYAVRALPYC